MKRSLALLSVVVLGCGSTSEGVENAPAHSVDLAHPPQSSLTALVRTLEVVDAMHVPGTDIRVRAVECDSMIDRRKQQEYVRVVLDVTVLAERYEIAEDVFAELTEALDTEGKSRMRPDSAAYGRVERVFASMDWSASTLPEDRFRKLVSVSDSIRVEVLPGSPAPPAAGSTEASLEGSQAVNEYIRVAAEDDRTYLGALETDANVVRPRAGTRDLRFHIRPEDRQIPYSRAQIGTFLYLLESRSPAMKVTHVTITPFEPGLDVSHDLWTFEADVSVRTPDDA